MKHLSPIIPLAFENPMINRRNFSLAAGAAALGLPAFAQSDVMRVVVGFPAGGIVDVIARELGEALKPHLTTSRAPAAALQCPQSSPRRRTATRCC